MGWGTMHKLMNLALGSLILTGCATLSPLPKGVVTPDRKTSQPATQDLPLYAQDRLLFIRTLGQGSERRSQLVSAALTSNVSPQLTDIRVILTLSGSMLSLSASQDGRSVMFTHQAGKTYPLIYQLLLDTGKLNVVSPTTAQNYSGKLSPKGNQLLYASSVDGNPEIYVKNLLNGTITRLTFDKAADIAPVWLDNGSFLFTSDRQGRLQPQLYYGSLANPQPQRVNLSGGYNAIARVSPTVDAISYTGAAGLAKIVPFSLKHPTHIAEQAGLTLDMHNTGEPINFLPNGAGVIYTLANQIWLKELVKTSNDKDNMRLQWGRTWQIDATALPDNLPLETVRIYEPIVIRAPLHFANLPPS